MEVAAMRIRCMILRVVALAGLASITSARADDRPPETAPFRKDPASVNTGVYQGAERDTHIPFRDTIVVPGAPWLRLHVGEHHLGRSSFLLIRSRQTGAVQKMTATALQNWRNHTAFFGGDALDVELHVAPG